MNTYDFDQRIEEIQLSLAQIFDSPKQPAVSLVDEGDVLVLHLSWVTQSERDTTLDARCAATLRATRAQIERYAGLDTAQRRTIQQRIGALVRGRYELMREASAQSDDCAIDLVLDDVLFDTESDLDYRPTL
ncbi:DUF3022 domain-containing protein [Paraburkholderia sp. J94]|uniref:DUF3022 domain-containing protein n=1 Tax=Paraburkholderia sp. J94 TaxID=2805441 RepID=UPI002AB15864|nr:hypothetical protein [Paraburkholderia sp. J94]